MISDPLEVIRTEGTGRSISRKYMCSILAQQFARLESCVAHVGAIFDPLTVNMIVGLIPTVIHVAVIQTLNMIFRRIAELLTEWENHKTEEVSETETIHSCACMNASKSRITSGEWRFHGNGAELPTG